MFVDPWKSGKKFWPGLALSPVIWGPLAWFINWIMPHQGGERLWLAPEAITCLLISIMIGLLIWKFFKWLNKANTILVKLPEGTAWYDQQKIVTTLVCDEPTENCPSPKKPRRHTISLIYEDVKATVCRPFSA